MHLFLSDEVILCDFGQGLINNISNIIIVIICRTIDNSVLHIMYQTSPLTVN
jgi:hypothetical protein